ncbi:MAG: hypothetical protein ABI376_05720 [Caulobacteraceae bacterium]
MGGAAWGRGVVEQAPRDGVPIDASFIDDRVTVDMPAPGGRGPLHLFTDTGGGSLLLSQDAAAKLDLSLKPLTDPDMVAELGSGVRSAEATPFVRRTWRAFPAHVAFVVLPEVIPMTGWPPIGDGILGRQWFAGHTWTWDYAHRQLILRPAHWRPPALATPLEVAFKTDADGKRAVDFARVTVRIDGEDLPVLFDTGATTILTPQALRSLSDGRPALRSTSMMAHGVIEGWRRRHPDWRVIEDAQVGTHALMILVPSVEIAGRRTGPVWITERSDKTFHEFISSMMSDRVEGAIGGNVLHGLAITLDYPDAKAWVE